MDAALQDAEERRQLAADLRSEARSVLVDTGLLDMLNARFGEAVVTGSAGYDLMACRELDIHMPCDGERWAEWAGLAADIAIQLGQVGLHLHSASFLNGHVEPHPLGAGLNWSIAFRDFAGNPWRCDIWGWEPFDFAVRQARDANLRADLDRCNRDLILQLKHEARSRPGYYGVMVGGFDIYEFVMAGAGETLDELERWKGLVA
jgi:hypothetical protein